MTMTNDSLASRATLSLTDYSFNLPINMNGTGFESGEQYQAPFAGSAWWEVTSPITQYVSFGVSNPNLGNPYYYVIVWDATVPTHAGMVLVGFGYAEPYLPVQLTANKRYFVEVLTYPNNVDEDVSLVVRPYRLTDWLDTDPLLRDGVIPWQLQTLDGYRVMLKLANNNGAGYSTGAAAWAAMNATPGGPEMSSSGGYYNAWQAGGGIVSYRATPPEYSGEKYEVALPVDFGRLLLPANFPTSDDLGISEIAPSSLEWESADASLDDTFHGHVVVPGAAAETYNGKTYPAAAASNIYMGVLSDSSDYYVRLRAVAGDPPSTYADPASATLATFTIPGPALHYGPTGAPNVAPGGSVNADMDIRGYLDGSHKGTFLLVPDDVMPTEPAYSTTTGYSNDAYPQHFVGIQWQDPPLGAFMRFLYPRHRYLGPAPYPTANGSTLVGQRVRYS